MTHGMHDARLDVRVSDQDRQSAADRLKLALDEGRLPVLEYDDRLGRAYAAVTYRDLAALFTDLPGPAPVASVPIAMPAFPLRPPTSTKAVSSLVLALIGVVACWIPVLGLGLDMFTIAHAGRGLRETGPGGQQGHSIATAGMVLGVLELIPSVLMTILVLVLVF